MGSPGRYEVELFGVDLNLDVFVFIKQCGIVHLPGDGAFFAGGRVFELQDFDRFGADRLRDGHAGFAGGGVGEDFNARPFVRIELGLHEAREQPLAGVVLAFAVVPRSAQGDLELDAGERVERLRRRLRVSHRR